ncbi:MAG: UDP-N-acetylmuramate dehydrogenase [Chloroflexi bacterium]|nr:UDP-N-acetylmuramate dehydrogenase [Chloroflexota bacterium]
MDTFLETLKNKGYGPRLLADEPLSRHTTFGIGGPADWLVVVESVSELAELRLLARKYAVPALVIGEGSNILIADAGVRGLVIVNRCAGIEMPKAGVLVAESGALLRKAARWSVERTWEGLEWASGVPGTIGGAVVGNAGAYGGCIADNLVWAELLHPDGRAERAANAALDYSYRSSALKRLPSSARPLVLKAAFELKPGNAAELERRMQGYNHQRQERTPSERSAGSVFKRTLQFPAGFLIEQCGLKGYQIGGAQVSPLHANFIINTGGASASDVAELIALIQRRVQETHGQSLELEIEFIGAWERETAAVNQKGTAQK